MRAFLLALLGPLLLSAARPQDAADDQYRFLAGLAEKGLHEQVVREAESFLREHPRHAKADHARYRLACALFELKREDQALEQFKTLASKRGFEFEAEVNFRFGQCALDAGDCAAAQQALARTVALDKDYLDVPARALLGDAQLACKRYADAEQSYAAVLERDKKGDWIGDALCGLAWSAFRQEHFEPARAQAQRYLERLRTGPRAGEMRFLRAEALLELGRAQDALADYAAVRDGPFADAALRGAGFARVSLGDQRGAALAFGELLERFPESRFRAECTLQRGIACLQAGDAAAALTALESKDAGETPELFYWRARAQAAAGKPDAALASIDRALASKPDKDLTERLRTARADVLTKSGRGDEAMREYERAGSDYALQAAAVASLDAGKPEEAVRLARKLLESRADSPYRIEALLALGEGLFAQKQYAPALDAFRAAAKDDKDVARKSRARSRAAWCQYLGGDTAGAAKAFGELAQELGNAPEAEEVAFMVGRSLEAAGQKAPAAQAYDRYLRAFPDGAHSDEGALRAARLADGDGAIAGLQRLVARRPDSPVVVEARYELGERLSAKGQLADASQHYRAVLERDPASKLAPAARYGWAWCQYGQGEYQAAAKELRTLASDAKLERALRESVLELLVWCDAKAGDVEALSQSMRAFLALGPDSKKLWNATRLALDALRKAERGDDALALLDAVDNDKREPSMRVSIAVERALLLLDKKDLDGAERQLRAAMRAAPNDPNVAEACFFVGEARFDAGQDAPAIELYEFAAKVPDAPQADRALYKAGFARLRSKDSEGAERDFAALVEGHPKSELFHEALFLLGEAQYRRGDYDAAIASLSRVRKEAPRHQVMPKVLFRLGLALGQRERWKESNEVLAALAKTYPQFENLPESELWRGRALARLGEARDARAALERTLAKDRGALSAQAHLELGHLNRAAHELDAALSEYLKVAVLYADGELVSEALCCAGAVLEEQGDKQRAVDQYKEIVEKYPKSRSAPTARQRLSELRVL